MKRQKGCKQEGPKCKIEGREGKGKKEGKNGRKMERERK